MNPEISQSVLDKINEEAESSAQSKFDHLLPNQPHWRKGYKAGRLKSIEEIEKLDKELERLKGLVKETWMDGNRFKLQAPHTDINDNWKQFKLENNL